MIHMYTIGFKIAAPERNVKNKEIFIKQVYYIGNRN